MIMKRLLLIFFLILSVSSVFSQNDHRPSSAYLIINTGSTSSDSIRITRRSFFKDSVHQSPTIIFRIRSPRNHISEDFIHSNYRDGSGQMRIQTLAISVLSELNPVDLNQLLSHSDRKSFRNFCLKLRDKTIYINDRNDINANTFKAIEVKHIRHLKY